MSQLSILSKDASVNGHGDKSTDAYQMAEPFKSVNEEHPANIVYACVKEAHSPLMVSDERELHPLNIDIVSAMYISELSVLRITF